MKPVRVVWTLWMLGLLLVSLEGCRRSAGSPSLRWHPGSPRPGDTLRLSWGQPVTGYLWLKVYEGRTPFLSSLQVVPLAGEASWQVVTSDSTTLLLVTLEDTTSRKIWTGPSWAVVFHDTTGEAARRAHEVLAALYFSQEQETLRAWYRRFGGWSLRRLAWQALAGEDTAASRWLRDSLQRVFPDTTHNPERLYQGWHLAAYALQDSALARRYLQRLSASAPQSLYTWKARLESQVWSPDFQRVVRDPDRARTLLEAYRSYPMVRRLILGREILRWYLPYAFVPMEQHAAYLQYLRDRLQARNLSSNDLVVMLYVAEGWLTNQPDTALQDSLLVYQERLLHDPVTLRQGFGATDYGWRRLSDFYRLLEREQNQFFQRKAAWALRHGRADEAYRLMQRVVNRRGDLFALWAEDLHLYARAALQAGHRKAAEEALAILRFFHADSSADSLLRILWQPLQDSMPFQTYLQRLESALGQKLPRAPDFVGRTFTGDTVRLKDLHGKVVVLNFWATWCGPCRQEIPELNGVVAFFQKAPEVVFLAVTDEDSATVARFLKDHSFAYRLVIQGRSIREAYRANAFPTHFILSPDGRIVFKQVGYIPGTAERLRERILALLQR